MFNSALTVRAASPDDSGTLAVLAWLNGRARPVAGKTLLAERDGVPVAAIALTSGTVLADPLNPATDAVALLRFTRYRLMRQSGQAGAERSLLRRARTRERRTSATPASA